MSTKPSGRYDVIIVGAGMTGIVTGLLLQKAGKRCLILESHNIGFGTTGGTTAHLNTLLDIPYKVITKNFNLEASRMVAQAASDSIRQIEDIIVEHQIACDFQHAKAFLFSTTDKESKELEDITESAIDAGLRVGASKTLPIATEYQNVKEFSDQGKFHPLKYLTALAAAFQGIGGALWENSPVTDVVKDNDGLAVTTVEGKFFSKNVIYATHIPPGINILHLKCAPWRSYAIALKPANDEYPSDLTYDMKDPYHYYRSQRIGAVDYVIVGGEDHKTGEDVETEVCFRKLIAHANSIFPNGVVTHRWSSQYYESTDGLPYIGHLPGGDEGVYVATGYGGNGMIYSHIAARELTRQITLGESLYNNLFSPARIKPVAGFTNFVDHNTHVIKELIKTHVDVEKIDSVSAISQGEGKVVKIENTEIAIYRDEQGRLTAVSPVCTHMKCNVVWNGTEKSWDCPCHGARYSPGGTVITGPARHDLQVIKLSDVFE